MRGAAISFLLLFAIQPCFAQSLDSARNTTSSSSNNKKISHWKKSEWILPAALFTTGAIMATNDNGFNQYIKEQRDKNFSNFSTHVDNYLQYLPAAVTFGLSVFKVEGHSDLPNQTVLFIKSEIIMEAMVFPLKNLTHEVRPDGSSDDSFPSGHTAQAFAAATFMAKEYGPKSVWYSIGAYSVATSVGVMRVLNDRHWVSDVIAGAGIGIISTNIAYATHQYRWGKKKRNELSFTPSYRSGTKGFYLRLRF
jgi:membrane-associated phospholipid phosphatase